jgi:hypothetical protein
LDHRIERFRDGRISIEDFTELKHWLESDFLTPDMQPYGIEVTLRDPRDICGGLRASIG